MLCQKRTINHEGKFTGSGPRSLFFLDDLPAGSGGLTPETSIISPDLFRGLGGGGCLRGSVGLSETDAFGSLVVGGGVTGLCHGEGGRGLIRAFACDGDPVFAELLTRLRGTENERDLQ